MTSPSVRTPDFPAHPEDGFVVIEYLDDGRKLVWTYNAALNQWGAQFVYPESPATEGWVEGQGYVKGPVRTRDVLTTDPLVKGESIIKTQEQVNELIADAATSAVKAAGRTTDQVDFLQNSIGKGTWIHTFAGVGIPQTSEFWTEGNVNDFADITKIYVNEKGIAPDGTNDPGTLADTRIGDYLVIQERGSNDFGMYVVESVAVEAKEEQTIREFGLRVYENRAKGASQVNASRCQITTSRPMYVVVQDDEPKVSTRGVLWYREEDDVLSISNYATGQVGVGGPQWTEINGGGDEGLTEIVANLDSRVAYGEQKQALIAANVDFVKEDALSKSQGGTISAMTVIDRPSGTGLKIKKSGVDHFKVEAGGKIFCNYNMSLDDDPTTVPNKGWVHEQIEAAPSGGSFVSEYDGNRFVRSGNMSTDLDSGDVLFMDAEYKQTTNPGEIVYISLPKDEFDWHAFTNSGNIKVKAGSRTAGYYYAYAYMHQASAQVLVSVFPLKAYPDEKLEADSGAPCYFHGLFFK